MWSINVGRYTCTLSFVLAWVYCIVRFFLPDVILIFLVLAKRLAVESVSPNRLF